MAINCLLKRMWINQPSTLQPYCDLHGSNVLVHEKDLKEDYMTVWFTKGDVISMTLNRFALSEGWNSNYD